jgi:hypothetical protein
MRIPVPPSPESATQDMPFPDTVECSFSTIASIAPVGGFEVSDGRIRLGKFGGCDILVAGLRTTLSRGPGQ